MHALAKPGCMPMRLAARSRVDFLTLAPSPSQRATVASAGVIIRYQSIIAIPFLLHPLPSSALLPGTHPQTNKIIGSLPINFLQGQLEADAQRHLVRLADDVSHAHRRHGGLVQIVHHDDAEPARRRLCQELLGLLDVCALQTNHHGLAQANLVGGRHDALRNDVTPHDAAKDVHQDGLDLQASVGEGG